MPQHDTPQQFRLREVCRHLLAAGIKPTPTILETFESNWVSRNMNKIGLSHGRLTAVRTEEFFRAGWKFTKRSARDGGIWMPPT